MKHLIESSQILNGEIKEKNDMLSYSEGDLSFVFHVSARVTEEEFKELLNLKSANRIGKTDFLQIDFTEYKELKDSSLIVDRYEKYMTEAKLFLIEFFF